MKSYKSVDPSPALLRQPRKVPGETLEASGGYTRHKLGNDAVDCSMGLNTAGQATAGGSGHAGNRTRMSVPPVVENVPGLRRLDKADTPRRRG